MGRMHGLEQIVRICSHQQSLAQCRQWLDEHLPDAERVPVSSNAEAARRARDEDGTAAIAGQAAAEVYGLNVIVPEIEAIATEVLAHIEAAGLATVIPTARATQLTMNREGIRRLAAEELGLPTSPYAFATSAAELAEAKKDYETQTAARAKTKREEAEQMAKMFGLPGFDDESNRAFAAKLSKYAGYRSVTYRGNGVFDVDYHFVGSAKQDFVFPALPDNDFLIPFIAIRRRADGSVFVTAPEFVGGTGPLGTRAAGLAGATKGSPISRADGRFTVTTDGEILTNNSEDGPSAGPRGREVHWDVDASSKKIPETLIRL
jgi:hypothetical protein